MRRAVEFLVTRLLRSRLGLAIGLAVVVLGIVGGARLFADPAGVDSGLGSVPKSPITTVEPDAGDDGAISAELTPSPITSPGAAPPEAVARAFVDAWLAHRNVSAERWHAALVPHATSALAEKLAGVDPAGVPADRWAGDPTVIPQAETLAEVTVPLDTGRLRLQLVAPNGRWLVDEVDWEQT